MATASSTIRAVMTMDTTRFQRGAKDAKASMKSLSSAATSVTGTIRTMMGIGAAAGFGASIKSSLDYQNSLIDLKDRLGVTTEGLSRLHHAAELSGVSQETMNMGLQRMTRRVAEAAQGTGEAVKALDELNISAERLKQLSPDEQFHVLADALKGVEEPADRTRIAMKLFDSEGVKLLQTMTDGSAGLRAMGEEADKMGVTVSEKAAKAARDANAQFVRLGNAGRGLANTMAIQLGPTIAEIAKWMSKKLPGAIDFTVKGFRLASVTVLNGIEILAGGLEKLYRYMSRIPIKRLSNLYAEVARDMATLKAAAEQGKEGLFAAMFEADTKALEKFSVETGKAFGTLQDFGLNPGESNEDSGTKGQEQAKKDAQKAAQRRFDSLTFSLAGEEGAIAESYARRQEIVANAHANKLISDEKRDALALELAQKHAEDLEKVQQATKIAQLSSYGELFDGLAGLSEAFGGKQSKTYKALFAASKAFAVAESLVSINTAMAKATAWGTFPANLAAMATVASQTAGIISTIKGTNIQGIAHSGMTNIPREGTYLLDGGERVIQPEQNKDLTRFLENGGSGSVVNIHNYSGQPVEQRQNGNQVDIIVGRVKDAIRDDLNRGRDLANDFQSTYGLTRQGVV